MGNDDTGDDAVDDPIVEMKQSELSKLMGRTRREGTDWRWDSESLA